MLLTFSTRYISVSLRGWLHVQISLWLFALHEAPDAQGVFLHKTWHSFLDDDRVR